MGKLIAFEIGDLAEHAHGSSPVEFLEAVAVVCEERAGYLAFKQCDRAARNWQSAAQRIRGIIEDARKQG